MYELFALKEQSERTEQKDEKEACLQQRIDGLARYKGNKDLQCHSYHKYSGCDKNIVDPERDKEGNYREEIDQKVHFISGEMMEQ